MDCKVIPYKYQEKDQGTEEIRSRINLARSAFSRLPSCFGRGVKYCCSQRAGSTWQQCTRFGSAVARHGLYE